MGDALVLEYRKKILVRNSFSLLAVICWARAPRVGVTRQGTVLTDLQSLLDCQ